MVDCAQVTIAAASSRVEGVVSETNVDGSTIQVLAYVDNIVEEGEGEDWSGELIITLDGEPMANSSVSAAAGSRSTDVEFSLTDVSDGDHEVCAEASGGRFV